MGPAADGTDPQIAVIDVAGRPAAVAVLSDRWVRLLAVAVEHRGQGLGSALLSWCEELARERGVTELSCCDEPGNYLSPGIELADRATLQWLERRGFRRHGENYSLLIDLQDNPKISAETVAMAIEKCQRAGYGLRRIEPTERGALVARIARTLSPAWAAEVDRAAHAPSGLWIASTDDALVGFAAHDGNNRGLGWFGPAWTDEAHRGHGIGAALVLACLRDVADAGHLQCTISWIGPRKFYDQVATIAGELRFAVMRKLLTASPS
ncbi:MAG: GNAT family N-acetyltransferase [Deltaproteobacteria bacterium]|nr:GNAT family N-acetyltransferase [Deltaproteobacteria bacterium]